MKTTPAQRDYAAFLGALKERILQARISAARAVNRELVLLYWDIGRGIVEKQESLGWGDGIVETLAHDLQQAFPEMRGFAPRSLWNMRRLFLAYSSPEILPQLVAELTRRASKVLPQPVAETDAMMTRRLQLENLRQLVAEIPWGHHLTILDKLADPPARIYYLRATARFGWSRNVLLNQIKAGAYERAVTEKKTHNFPLALPEYLAEQADEAMKSSYNLEFLGIHREIKERELEDRLVSRLQQFILELGYGFCFVGRQYRIPLGSTEYFVDLLFYHRFLKALVAFDLKIGAFQPEHAGKMDFYLNLLNDKERGPGDRPSIGIILCAQKDDIAVEYALKAKRNPIGVAEYHLHPRLPAEFKGRLPSARQLADAVREALPMRKE